jgi:outer membrane protein assembly factor BamB
VVVATEANVVAALDARTGATVWTRSLGAPVPLSALPCGNIDPLGITGTPVVDAASRTVYLDAMTSPDGGATKRHLVFALSLDDGAVRDGWPVDVAAALAARGQRFDAGVQNQRGALALVAGYVYVPFGGHNGDCGDYHGWLVAIPVAGPSETTAWSTPARGGGSWAPGGVASDAGQVFITTGNTFGADVWSGGEAILRFPAGATLGAAPDSFAPSNWHDLDDGDVDIGGTGPVLVDVPGATPSRLAVGLGKDGKIYLVDRDRLGGIGGAVAVGTVSDDPIITAAAAYTTAGGTYVAFPGSGVACPGNRAGGLIAVRIVPGAPPKPVVAWCAPLRGRGSPIVTTTDGSSDAIVWIVGAEGDGELHAFEGETGTPVLEGVSAGGDVRRFQAPIAVGGRLYVAVEGGLRAFAR